MEGETPPLTGHQSRRDETLGSGESVTPVRGSATDLCRPYDSVRLPLRRLPVGTESLGSN